VHIDEKKRYDKRTIERSLREGLISLKEYERHLANLPDVSDKIFAWGEEDNKGKGKDRKKSNLDRVPDKKLMIRKTRRRKEVHETTKKALSKVWTSKNCFGQAQGKTLFDAHARFSNGRHEDQNPPLSSRG